VLVGDLLRCLTQETRSAEGPSRQGASAEPARAVDLQKANIQPRHVRQFHVFLASPSDMNAERGAVREFFQEYNRTTADNWSTRFEVIDWENYSSAGVGRPQELITKDTLERFRSSLALVIGLMGQRFGSPTGTSDSGTEEESDWALNSHRARTWPEIKWFFRDVEQLIVSPDP